MIARSFSIVKGFPGSERGHYIPEAVEDQASWRHRHTTKRTHSLTIEWKRKKKDSWEDSE